MNDSTMLRSLDSRLWMISHNGMKQRVSWSFYLSRGVGEIDEGDRSWRGRLVWGL